MPIVNNRLVSRFNNAARRPAASPDGGASGRLGERPAEPAPPPAGATVDAASIVDDAGRRPAKPSAATKTAATQAERAARRQRATQGRAAFVAEARAAQEAMRQTLAAADAEPARVQRPAKQNRTAPPKSPPRAPNAARQPPAQHQFKAGQSGNPAGRPKGSRNRVVRGALARMVLEEAERAAPGRVGVSAHRAVVRTLFDMAADGDVRAATLILPMAAEAEGVVADLNEAAEAREAEAAAAQQARNTEAAADGGKSAAEEEALAARLAAENPEVYRHARDLMNGKWGVPSGMRFMDAVAQARVQVALGQSPFAVFDRHLAAAALAKAAAAASEQNEDEEEDDDT